MADGESDYQVGSGCCAGRAPLSPLLWKSTQGRGWGLASRAQHHQGGTPKLFAMFKHWSGPPDEQCYDLFWLFFSGCALSAGLFGYGIGYLNGVRDATTANADDGDRGFSED